jgi:hypothetical protein
MILTAHTNARSHPYAFTIQEGELSLDRCIGFGGSLSGNACPSSALSLASNDAFSGIIAYTAGSTVVLMEIKSKHQVGFFRSGTPGLPFGCLAFGGTSKGTTAEGRVIPKYLAAGEVGASTPQVRRSFQLLNGHKI